MDQTAPWTLIYADGSGNVLRVDRPSSGGPARYRYTPVTPRESSSGTYSGGEPGSGHLGEPDFQELQTIVRDLASREILHVTARVMGSGSFVVTSAGGERRFLVRSGADLQRMDALVRRMRAR